MTNKKSVILIISITIVIFLLLIVIDNRIKNSKDELKKNYNIEVGYFLSYYKAADSGTSIVEYYYYVNNKKYVGNIYTDAKYRKCQNSNQCKEKKFWVIYSPDNPRRSLIDLTMEIQDMEDPPFPKTLENFK